MRTGMGYARDGTLRFTVLRQHHANLWNMGAEGTVPTDYNGPFYDSPFHPRAEEEVAVLNEMLFKHYPDQLNNDPWRVFMWDDAIGWVDVKERYRGHPSYGECPT